MVMNHNSGRESKDGDLVVGDWAKDPMEAECAVQPMETSQSR